MKTDQNKKYVEIVDTVLGEQAVINDWVILTMPLKDNALPGRSHTASCTLCRDRQIASGSSGGPAAGAIGFFRNEAHRDQVVKNHAKAHFEEGVLIHIVNLPARIRLMNLEDESHGR